jgi:hypothetical protein
MFTIQFNTLCTIDPNVQLIPTVSFYLDDFQHFQLSRLKQLGVESLAQGLNMMAHGEVRTCYLAVTRLKLAPLSHHVPILLTLACVFSAPGLQEAALELEAHTETAGMRVLRQLVDFRKLDI